MSQLGLALATAALFAVLPWAAAAFAHRGRAGRSGYERWALRTAPSIFLAVGLASFILRPKGGAAVGAALVLLLGLRVLPDVLRARTKRLRVAQLDDPAMRDGAVEAIERDLARGVPPSRYLVRAGETLDLAAHAFAAGMTDAALRWVSRLDSTRILPAQTALRAQIMAVGLVARGDVEGASASLASVSRPAASPAIEEAMQALEALVLAIAGKLDDARAAERAETQGATRTTWRIVRAHSMAANGSRDDAAALLRALRDDSGDRTLEMIARHNGPASPLAASILATPSGPYR